MQSKLSAVAAEASSQVYGIRTQFVAGKLIGTYILRSMYSVLYTSVGQCMFLVCRERQIASHVWQLPSIAPLPPWAFM